MQIRITRASAILATAAAIGLLPSLATAESAHLTQADDPYFKQAEATLQRVMTQQKNIGRARNVILFVGDGMGFSTVTATRILAGQRRGVDGESNVLTFESLPYLAASKTYSSDGQVSDSAPTATAMTTGVKTRNDVIGVSHDVAVGDCKAALAGSVTTIFEMAETAGMSTGAISTARITHATPAATFAHTPMRDWESDAEMPAEAAADGCVDIARQLVEMKYGDGMEVALGGGRAYFLPAEAADPEDEGKMGRRKDGRDLTRAWTQRYGNNGAYVWNARQLDAIDPADVDHLLGLFETSHMEYEADRAKDKGGEPSLAEMTVKAIDILKKNPQGFVLMVEGGRIDHAHHAGNAYRALTDGIAFDEAIEAAMSKVDLDETLIVVTADHSHSLTINGYPQRGNPILGISRWDGEPVLADDKKPYTTLSYANGPGARSGERADLGSVDTTDMDFVQQALVPMASETHTGEDLGIYAGGPWAHLFQGTVEQNYIYHVIDFASKISERAGQRAAR
ncbi:MAG TPA: alkaline phosphatase [Geminicoccaceae bacterium]|nr:alkaline phosphatase [Geminicoccus sp.]HMU49819.1 alkaline phosphatase [Geminicoccaceae bacterium]